MNSGNMFPRVRTATLQDAEVIATYNIMLGKETEGILLDPEEVLIGVKTDLSNPDVRVYYLLEVGDTVVGQATTWIEWLPLQGQCSLWIDCIFVHPNHRRKGYFRMLYNRAKEEARKIGAVSIKLYADTKNELAKHTYRNLGMEEGGKVYETGDLVKN